jgi:hypothetical protein
MPICDDLIGEDPAIEPYSGDPRCRYCATMQLFLRGPMSMYHVSPEIHTQCNVKLISDVGWSGAYLCWY